ncbi:MAG: M24 family metallopeptidase [Spirulinaceae cyanobacterium RM2_2_10]|nr:M24 family metallopeptidase [Spirulinaceae cyanobacterium RM2_2_10]
MAAIGNSSAIFRSAPLATAHNDVEHPFRQESDFFYLTGFNEPDAVAVLAPHHEEHRFILFVQPKDPERETWTGYRVGVEQAQALYGADAVYSIHELDTKLPEYLKKAERLYYRFSLDRAFDNTVLRHWQKLLRLYPKNGYAPRALEDVRFVLHPLRQLKSEAELTAIRRATAIATAAHNRAREVARPGLYEYQIQAEIEYVFRMSGASGPAYPSIVASGPNACILHYVENNRQLQAGDLLLIDAGCAFGYYNSDITRTFPVGGQFNREQQIIYELVLEAQQQAIAAVKPGEPYNAFHDAAVATIVDGLLDLKLLTGDRDEIIKEEKYKHFFMHRTGHWLGLDVHDAGGYKQNEEDWLPLQPGHVVTVEPGIYIAPDIRAPEGQPEVPAEWRGIGVRIEDDVLVTAQGCEVLTEGVPKAIAALAAAA